MQVTDRKAGQSTDTGLFFREFIRSPIRTAAVAPSSRFLAEQITVPVAERGDPVVVELGPGTGAFTKEIQRRLRGRGRHLAIELNPRLADLLGKRYPEVDVVCGDASTLPDVLAERGLRADVVVSGLPWVAFPTTAARPLLTLVAQSLAEGGVFTQFTYGWTRWTTPARRQLQNLRDTFEEVVVSRTVWRNIPPAVVYLARRPRVAGAGGAPREAGPGA
ncbi:class I SAM-dependent methyltransferase [Goodfellowiella coeruleoviolacea]|uniref:Phospholipid N-methyltransferase n=1 Tax=Goodfellowiella coeruleoviolacea TaxID=334858 RepID=A0AAE3G9C7_9PSEU|nr:methyltransferase domain-containing protein [Goodfellowiella coeruleoviolacea]MCP2164081.1 Phospholipid N-methyltransferase [Goodfellowiella coeruleoviolacea]